MGSERRRQQEDREKRRTNASEDVASGEGDRDGLLLDWTRTLETSFEDAHEKLAFEKVVLEVVAFGVEDVLRRGAEGDGVGIAASSSSSAQTARDGQGIERTSVCGRSSFLGRLS